MTGRRGTPNDPERRERILDAALEVIAEQGVHRTTHRRIAARAQVPLGSLTYYFDGLPEILRSAFVRFVDRLSGRYWEAVRGAEGTEAACAGIVEMICGDRYTSPQEQTILVELYSYGSFDAQVGAMRRQWQDRSQEALAAHFDRDTARALDALLEGWTLHRGFGDFRADRGAVERAVHRLAGQEPAQRPSGSGAGR